MSVCFRWESEPDYCSTVKKTPPYDKGTRLVDFIDLVVLDFLMSRFILCAVFCERSESNRLFIKSVRDELMKLLPAARHTAGES